MSVPARRLVPAAERSDHGAVPATQPRFDPRHAPAAPPAPQQRTDVSGTQPDTARSVQPAHRRFVTPTRLFFLATLAALGFGYSTPTEHYLTPEDGFGYALGILGGSLMLLLLLYPARKRAPWLAFIGTTRRWFQAHMVFGVVGPLCVLFHSNFSLGATNSNVALVCMLVVAGSGLFGRYFYARIHHGLYGRKATLAELNEHAERLRLVTPTVAFLPELMARLQQEEQQVLAARARLRTAVIAPVRAAWRVFRARMRLRRHVRRALGAAARSSTTAAAQRRRLQHSTYAYIDARLTAARRIAELQGFERLFSLWHVLHLPLFFIMLIAGVVHVVAAHVY